MCNLMCDVDCDIEVIQEVEVEANTREGLKMWEKTTTKI